MAKNSIILTETDQELPNQCDGCKRGLPIDANMIHRESSGYPFMVCDADRYVITDQKEES